MKEIVSPKMRVVVGVGSVLLLLLLVGGVVEMTAERRRNRVDSVVTVEANPVVELSMNCDGTVVAWSAENREARELTGELQLKGLFWRDALDQVLREMKVSGELNGEQNAILITVNKEHGETDDWEDAFSEEVRSVLREQGVSAAVLSQTLKHSRELRELAEECRISEGKAALLCCMTEEGIPFSAEELAGCSITDLVWLAVQQEIPLEGFRQSGNVSVGSKVEPEEALRKAAKTAGVKPEETESGRAVLECEGGMLFYKVSFVCGEREFACEIALEDGQLLRCEWEEIE